jgi:hypothetical protein
MNNGEPSGDVVHEFFFISCSSNPHIEGIPSSLGDVIA